MWEKLVGRTVDGGRWTVEAGRLGTFKCDGVCEKIDLPFLVESRNALS